ncbi:hypothetical protein HZY62_01740 [Maribacter polysiphoniae]|uniref:Uncharacterized protein n=1 Tax=Maribacter polysiphoniae TaxID=429344 RepID=A0A316E449_9FLAO|nr:hypothetical protein [Maribacter polysiphoniae]MBD1259295.1 hypothetical protein [Maribacter polysiphoniae]PWK24855.1 hypothetical protein LX92_01221 [Maribacter polysiphoniae]
MALIFIMGLAQEIMVKYSADTAIVFALELDGQDDSESDVDGNVLDFDLPVDQMLLTKDFSMDKRFKIATYLNLGFQIIGISQPTPPPEYLG